jgi:uncharacterized protein YndB with AHSA1/START domain
MPVVEASVAISRPPSEVFQFVTSAENLPKWDSATLQAVQRGSGPPQLGTRTDGVSKILGRRISWTTEVTAFEPGHLASWTSVEGPLRFTATSVVEPLDDGTWYTYRVEGESGLGGVFGRMTDPFVVRGLNGIVRTNLVALKDLLTSSVPR